MNAATKLIESHLVSGEMRAGEEIGIRIDQTLAQDATGTMVMLEFAGLGIPRVRTELSAQYVDHNLLQVDWRNADDHLFLRSACEKFGVWWARERLRPYCGGWPGRRSQEGRGSPSCATSCVDPPPPPRRAPSRDARRRFNDGDVALALSLVADGRTLGEAGAAVGASHPTVLRLAQGRGLTVRRAGAGASIKPATTRRGVARADHCDQTHGAWTGDRPAG